jgi:hypothetical protein
MLPAFLCSPPDFGEFGYFTAKEKGSPCLIILSLHEYLCRASLKYATKLRDYAPHIIRMKLWYTNMGLKRISYAVIPECCESITHYGKTFGKEIIYKKSLFTSNKIT